MKDAGITSNKFRNDSAFQRGLEAGGRLLVEGSVVLGQNGGSVPSASSSADLSDTDIPYEQELLIEKLALARDCWFDNPRIYYDRCGYRLYGYGGEAQVFAEGDSYVHKICRTGQYPTLQLFFERIVIQNTVCPVASLEIEGFGRDSFGDFVILMRQRFFRQAYLMSDIEVAEYMQCLGFRRVIEEPYHKVKYLSDAVVAEDLHSGNIWKTPEGNVVIVDGAFAFTNPS